MESWGLVSTYDDVEGEYLDNLRKLLGHDRIWAVGPLILKMVGATSPSLDTDVDGYVDTCDADSVIYVAFGS